jgi:hypothetical protein
MHKMNRREIVQCIAALRFWGRAAEQRVFPELHPMVKARFSDNCLPMTLDEIETLIGRLDGSHTGRGLRPWDPRKFL